MEHPRFEKRFGKIRGWLSGKRVPAKVVFIVMGILATAWFLIRVIPKPSRAGYPCMKAAFPIMATFVLWLASFTGAFVAFRSMGRLFRSSKYLAGLAIFVAGLASSAILINTGTFKIAAKTSKKATADVVHIGNQPMGEAQGIFPGRVIWNWDPNATNEDCTNTGSDPFVSDANTNQPVVDEMIHESIIALGGGEDAAASWDRIFKHFNNKKGKGEVGYTNGEIIFIKINEGTSSWRSSNDLSRRSWDSPMTETSPQVTLGILKQLIEEAGIPQENIWVADPKSHIWQESYEKFHAVYPDVKYGDRDGDYDGTRDLLTEHASPSIYFSDKMSVMPDADNDVLYEQMVTADYLINLAALKAHARAGITLTAKNHFGSHNRGGAWHMHPGLVAPENDQVERPDYGMYRVLVDIMGSSVLGGNTLLFLVDGLWGGTEATEYPVKWTMEPFNNDWPSSIFMSLDQVALESVCFDFLRHEASVGSSLWKDRPNFAQGVDDYLQQAADPANWPDGVEYDPDNSGTPIGSLGTHEHWNNADSKQYSWNLGRFKGIELYAIPHTLVEPAPFESWNIETVPTIDGSAEDDAWSQSNWFYLDQLWIPYGENTIPDEDFNGRFKVVWSAENDLVYFLAETEDDVFVDGYTYPETNYPDYDILEVFLDEDMSGGAHVFDNGSENAENAFAYHIAIQLPDDQSSTTTAHVLDIAGTGWGDRQTPDYFDHFESFVVKRNGNKLTWEFALKIYDDTYDPGNPEASRVDLEEGKQMGISLAYCDNDDPLEDPLTRDNFFGSVEVSEAAYNDHWKDATDFGEFTFKGEGSLVNHAPVVLSAIEDYVFQDLGTTVTIVTNLYEIFSDEDGDMLTFTATSDDAEVTATVVGNSLEVSASESFTGPAQITVMADDGEYTEQVVFEISAPVGIALNAIDQSLNIYPNPVQDELQFSFDTESTGGVFIRIVGMNGQLHHSVFMEKQANTFRQSLDVSRLEKGVYILEIHHEGATVHRRFLK